MYYNVNEDKERENERSSQGKTKMALTQKQINDLVAEYKKYYDGDEEVTEEKVLNDLQEYMKDFTDYEDLEQVPFEELIDFIG